MLASASPVASTGMLVLAFCSWGSVASVSGVVASTGMLVLEPISGSLSALLVSGPLALSTGALVGTSSGSPSVALVTWLPLVWLLDASP